MSSEKIQDSMPVDEARRQMALVCRRLGLLHLAFAETLVETLGADEGQRLLGRAVGRYGRWIGEEKRRRAAQQGLEPGPESFLALSDLPDIGMHERIEPVEVAGEQRIRAHGCVMGKLWQERGKGELGRFYCLVDPASSMAFDPGHKLVHTKALPDGDPYCELVMRPATQKDRSELDADDPDWSVIEHGDTER